MSEARIAPAPLSQAQGDAGGDQEQAAMSRCPERCGILPDETTASTPTQMRTDAGSVGMAARAEHRQAQLLGLEPQGRPAHSGR